MPKTKKVNSRPAKTNSHTRQKPTNSSSQHKRGNRTQTKSRHGTTLTLRLKKNLSQKGGVIKKQDFNSWAEIKDNFGKTEQKSRLKFWEKNKGGQYSNDQENADIKIINDMFENNLPKKRIFCNSEGLTDIIKNQVCYTNDFIQEAGKNTKDIINQYIKTRNNSVKSGLYICIINNSNYLISQVLNESEEICVIFNIVIDNDTPKTIFKLGYVLKPCGENISSKIKDKLSAKQFYVYKNRNNELILCYDWNSNGVKQSQCVIENSKYFKFYEDKASNIKIYKANLARKYLNKYAENTIFKSNDIKPYFPEDLDLICGNVLLFKEYPEYLDIIKSRRDGDGGYMKVAGIRPNTNTNNNIVYASLSHPSNPPSQSNVSASTQVKKKNVIYSDIRHEGPQQPSLTSSKSSMPLHESNPFASQTSTSASPNSPPSTSSLPASQTSTSASPNSPPASPNSPPSTSSPPASQTSASASPNSPQTSQTSTSTNSPPASPNSPAPASPPLKKNINLSAQTPTSSEA